MTLKHYKLTVMFDLDETLFTCRFDAPAENEANYTHMSKASQQLHGHDCHLIYRDQAAEMFKNLLLMGKVRIGFITAAEYNGSQILPFLEQEYGLPAGALKSALFINGSDLGDRYTLKGVKLDYLRRASVFAPCEEVILVDDNSIHLESAAAFNFHIVQATGYLLCMHHDEDGSEVEFYNVDPRYFEDIRIAIVNALELYNRNANRMVI